MNNAKQILTPTLAALIWLPGCGMETQNPNQLTAEEREAGFELIFGGPAFRGLAARSQLDP